MRVYTITHPNARYAMKPIDATRKKRLLSKCWRDLVPAA
jgi:hypothetical protein